VEVNYPLLIALITDDKGEEGFIEGQGAVLSPDMFLLVH
jgi:hypothetical protein